VSDQERDAMTELLIRLEQASVENAKAFVVVATDAYTGDVISTCGPFAQPEQALAEAGRMDAEWRGQAENEVEADAIKYVVVAQWEPSQ
jgi:hypothetical protein